jgi:hypothetical protein
MMRDENELFDALRWELRTLIHSPRFDVAETATICVRRGAIRRIRDLLAECDQLDALMAREDGEE